MPIPSINLETRYAVVCAIPWMACVVITGFLPGSGIFFLIFWFLPGKAAAARGSPPPGCGNLAYAAGFRVPFRDVFAANPPAYSPGLAPKRAGLPAPLGYAIGPWRQAIHRPCPPEWLQPAANPHGLPGNQPSSAMRRPMSTPITEAIIRPRVQPLESPRQCKPWMLVFRASSILTRLL